MEKELMKNKFFKISFIFLLLCVCITSCKKKEVEIVEEPKKDDVTTFTFFSADSNVSNKFTDMIAKIITEKTGVKLEIYGPESEPSDEIALMLAKGSYPDFIYAKGDLPKLIEANAVIPLDYFIETDGANVKKLYGDQLSRLKYTEENPSIYALSAYEIKTKRYETAGTMQIQHNVLKEFGYPRITTLEEYENILYAYKNKYPTINGKNTIGISLNTDGWYWLLSLSNPGNFVLGYQDDGQWIVNQETLEAQYKFLHPDMHTFYKWLNKMYHLGLLDPESFTQTEEQWREKIKNGNVLGTSFPLWGLKELNSKLVSADMGGHSFAFLPVTAAPEIKDSSLKDYGFSGGWGMSITSTCKNKPLAFKFLDWFCSEEAQILVNWGVKDIHYAIDENGKRYETTNIPGVAGIGKWTYPFPQAGSGYLDSTGNPFVKSSEDSIMKNYSFVEKETLSAYGVKMWTEMFPSPQELGVSTYGQVWLYPLTPASIDLVDRADAFVKQAIIQMVIGDKEDFDSAWKNMQQGLREMGIEKAEIELTNLIKSRMDFWTN